MCYADSMSGGTPFDDAEYISLRSYRRAGTAVDTPVWCATLDGKLVVFTLRESYKVGRVRRNPRVQVARCDMRGRLLGPWVPAQAVVLEPGSEQETRAYQALTSKYGFKMRIGNFFSALTGRKRRRVVLEISLGEAPQAP
jgi:uncharacterized protein